MFYHTELNKRFPALDYSSTDPEVSLGYCSSFLSYLKKWVKEEGCVISIVKA